MTVPVDEILKSAQGWLGTPYRHQASCKGAGADCLGLLRGIWREVYGAEPETVPAYSADWSEPQGEEALWQASARHLTQQARGLPQLGEVVLFRMRETGVAKHLGVVSRIGAERAFIHAYSRHGVVESPLSEPWARRVAARFKFPERTN